MKLNKAISPILATVILIAITLVIAIGVIGWIMGIWGSLGGPSESLVVVGSSATCSDNTLTFTLSITNKGTADAVIKKVEVLGISSTTTISPTTISRGTSTDIEVTVAVTDYKLPCSRLDLPSQRLHGGGQRVLHCDQDNLTLY
jgi:flagellin-like protein